MKQKRSLEDNIENGIVSVNRLHSANAAAPPRVDRLLFFAEAVLVRCSSLENGNSSLI